MDPQGSGTWPGVGLRQGPRKPGHVGQAAPPPASSSRPPASSSSPRARAAAAAAAARACCRCVCAGARPACARPSWAPAWGQAEHAFPRGRAQRLGVDRGLTGPDAEAGPAGQRRACAARTHPPIPGSKMVAEGEEEREGEGSAPNFCGWTREAAPAAAARAEARGPVSSRHSAAERRGRGGNEVGKSCGQGRWAW